jgi:aspartyl-tRNA(Asn)/glutamyl-tRNA(Gln) amidotransferase subunit A
MNLSKLTITEARRALDAGEYTSLELTNEYLDAIKARDGEIHAYLEVWGESAREEAKAADLLIKAGKAQPLTGIPLAVKDNMLIKGRIVSAASKMLEHYTASYDAFVIEKLKAQGAVLLGRTNMDEFAMGSSTENSAFGPTKNPLDLSRVPGGSSGGSAAAVAGNLAVASLGSDTGGSIRQPASLTGLVGLKPTYGSVSRYGLIAMGSSLDQIGSFGHTVADTKILFDATRGNDPHDSTSIADYELKGNAPKVIGVPRSFLSQGVDPDVLDQFEKTLEVLRAKGYEVRDIELPNVPHSLAVYYIIMPAEVSTNLGRLDGIRYGLSVTGENIQEVYGKSRAAGFGPETRRRVLVGTFVLSAGYVDAYYRRAQKVRAAICEEFVQAFASGIDAIVTPTTPSPAFKFGAKSDPVAMYAEDVFAVPVNLAGVPAISVPNGTVEREGVILPTGFQIIAPHMREDVLFKIGQDVERA